MSTVLQLKQAIATYLETTIAALTITGLDLTLLALNNARRTAELEHDFSYSQTNLNLAIQSNGAAFTNSTQPSTSVTIPPNALSPDVSGIYPVVGQYNGAPMYALTITGVQYAIFYSNTNQWFITSEGFTPTNYFSLVTAALLPNGEYSGHGSYSGIPTVTGATPSVVGIKRIQNVILPIANGDSIPIEFLTNDDWNARVKRQIGRQAYNSSFTLAQLGFYSENPVCYQQGQTLNLVPASQFTFPVNVSLSVVQWMPDYVNDTDTDYFTINGPEFLQWQGIIECNKLIKFFVQRREGNLDEENLQAEAQAALQALIAWDIGIASGTSTPATAAA